MIEKYLNINLLITYHSVIEKAGLCRIGIKEPGLLSSAIDHMCYYKTDKEKIFHVIGSIDYNHIFNDGNKRTCLLVLLRFFYNFNENKAADILLEGASHKISKEEFQSKLQKFFYKKKVNYNNVFVPFAFGKI